jgi:energy-coupling factor transport system ATP-binding protein
MTDAFIAVEDVSYAYPLPGGGAVPALRGVSLRIGLGEYVAVVGANGSGKSTLARHLNALLRPDAGRVRVAGLDTRDRDWLREIRRTVGMVFQRPEDQIVATVVAQDVAFGPENLGLPPDVIRARVREALEMLGMWDLRARPPHQLSAGQLQRVALAGVLAMRPRCVVFDEATAMLDPAGRRAVRALMQRLHREGLTVIEITHFMEEALDAQRVIVLDRGRVALDGPPEAVFSDAAALEALGLGLPPVAELARALRRRVPALPPGLLTAPALVAALDALPRPTRDAPARVGPTGGGVDEDGSRGRRLIEVAHLDHVYMQGTPLACRALSDVSLAVAEGVPHGLLGATGSGKSTLMQHLNGLLRPQAGSVRVAGVDLGDPDVDLRAVRRMAGLVFQMPEAQLFEQYVGDEIAYGLKLLGLDRPTIRARVRWAMSLVGLDFEGTKDRLTFALSGGEQRKVALASILALRPRILLLDEPTAGLDPASRREVLAQVQAFQAQGLTLVLSSHRMEDLAQLAERLTVLDGGAVALSGSTPAVFAQGSRLAALGLSRPVAAEVAAALRQRGWPLSKAIVRPAQLIEGVARLLSRATDEAQG